MVIKARRKELILELVENEAITSQEQLREKLKGHGVQVTQATLSRDIQELNLVKRAADGAYRRAVGDPVSGQNGPGLQRAVGEYLRTFEAVEQLLVLRTDPGQAQSL